MRKLLLLALLVPVVLLAQPPLPVPEKAARAKMDRDLMDVTVDKLHAFYHEHRYTVTQVVEWRLDRIAL
ncbi:MAG: hypothetical protein WBE76_14870 [Terracidiphilus sp.]